MKYNKLCEMNVIDLISTMMSPPQAQNVKKQCNVIPPIQPTDGVGTFGNSLNINIKVSDDGGLEINFKDMAVKVSKEVFEAIKQFINKGD